MGLLVSDSPLESGARMESGTQQQRSPADSPEVDFVVRVVEKVGGSGPNPLLSGFVGGVIGVLGALGAQYVAARFARGHRLNDRRQAHIEALLEAVIELEKATVEDMSSPAPSQATSEKLLVATRRFNRANSLVQSAEVRSAAEEWQQTYQRHALTSGEPDETGPTATQVQLAETKMMDAVSAVFKAMR